jgi:hypothetical protein
MGFTDLNKPSKTLGADDVNVSSPNSVFGEILVTQPIPNAQGDFVYNINNQTFTTSSFAGATVTQQDGMAVLQSGTSASGSATIQLRRGLEYRPGQGSMLRETAIFDTPDAGNAMFIGAGTAECGYFVGYFGESFGILHSETGAREIRRLDITTGATTGNATVTLNGSSASIAVAGGSSPEQTAYQLALGDYSQVGTGGWLADAQSGSVYFISARAAAAFDGSYSVAGSSIVGSFTQVVDSVAQTSTFIPSGSFNIDKLDGSGPSGMTINPQRGNVYQVAFQYLGFGNTPVLKNPNLFVLATSANIGGTTSRTLKTVSMASFTEGSIQKLDPKFAKSFSFSGLNTSNVYKPLAVLKSNRVFNDQSNFGEFDLLKLAISNETAGASGKTITIGLFLGAIISGEVNFQYTDEQQSIVSYAELNPATQTINNLSDLTPFYTITAGPAGTQSDKLETLKLIFQIGRQVLIAVKTSGSATGTTSVNWFEQQ